MTPHLYVINSQLFQIEIVPLFLGSRFSPRICLRITIYCHTDSLLILKIKIDESNSSSKTIKSYMEGLKLECGKN
jgi:hypothetical protein